MDGMGPRLSQRRHIGGKADGRLPRRISLRGRKNRSGVCASLWRKPLRGTETQTTPQWPSGIGCGTQGRRVRNGSDGRTNPSSDGLLDNGTMAHGTYIQPRPPDCQPPEENGQKSADCLGARTPRHRGQRAADTAANQAAEYARPIPLLPTFITSAWAKQLDTRMWGEDKQEEY